MLPTVVEEGLFKKEYDKYLAQTKPTYEIAFNGVLTKRGNMLLCSSGIFEGLFEDLGFDQNLVSERRGQYGVGSDQLHEFVDELVSDIYKFGEKQDSVPIVRIAVDKYVDDKFNKHYKKYLDVHLNLIKTDRDKKILENVVYFLVRFSAGSRFIVQSKRRQKDASEIRTLFPESFGSGELPLSI